MVKIGIDPPSEETMRVLHPFLVDRRIHVYENHSRLGWAGNIRALTATITTPYFTVLPHDDLIHPGYLHRLLEKFKTYPDASVVYADMQLFGNGRPSRKWVDLPVSGSREEQILAFFQQGAEAVPWRGVTRSDIIQKAGGFPVDDYLGFAVECEWALSLISVGRAVRVPEKLYFKQLYHNEIMSASKERIVTQNEENRYLAWKRHRKCMLDITTKAVAYTHPLYNDIMSAAELAMEARRKSMVKIQPVEKEPFCGGNEKGAEYLHEICSNLPL